ncbi:MAG: ABC transporter ATP-binding protein [Phycisphaeraceae bacterium]|nr:MAG: ABC transporter ATP-binding protein [Phycisphaeraceae bacterium]
MIRCVDVWKSYRTGGRSVEALRGVDLVIEEPGFYAIMGASGSGKSTLLHLLAALDVPDRGELHVGGRRIDGLSERELTAFRRHEIGIVFQQFNLIATMTAAENVALPGLLAGQPARTLRARSLELLEQLGLAERADHRPEALSGGEQQRVAIARALLYSPSVLFADEPTGNLDSRSSEALWEFLRSLSSQREMTVIMVTHEPAAAAHCRRAYLLSDGRVTGEIGTEGLDASGIAAEYQRVARSA